MWHLTSLYQDTHMVTSVVYWYIFSVLPLSHKIPIRQDLWLSIRCGPKISIFAGASGSLAASTKFSIETDFEKRSDIWMFSEEFLILDLCSWNSWVRSLTGTNSHWSEPEHEEELFDENKNWNILVLEQWRKNAVNCIVLISRKSTNSRIDPLKW